MMATTFGHNFNFAAAKQNIFNNFRPTVCLSVSRSVSLFLSLSLSFSPWVKIFIFSKCQQMFSIHFLRHLQRTLPGPAFLCECTRRAATKLDEMSSFPLGLVRGLGTRGEGQVGVPWAKRAQASTTTRMTSRSSRRLSATATATSDARKGLTKRSAGKCFFCFNFPQKTFDAKAPKMKEVAEMPQNIYIIYIVVGGCIFRGRFETRGLSMPLTVLKRSVKLLNECERRRATPFSIPLSFSFSSSRSFTISICAKLLIKKLSRHARLADFFSARYSSIQFNSIQSSRIVSNRLEWNRI